MWKVRDIMKEIFKNGGKTFVKILIVNLMSFFAVLSFSVLATGLFTKNIGYTAYGTTSESAEEQELYTYYYADGEDEQLSAYQERGYTVRQSTIRSQLSKKGNITFLLFSQIFSLLILFSFLYPNLWQLGTKDSNLVKFKHVAGDPWKGAKIGAVAVIPNYTVLLILAVIKIGRFGDFPLAIYRFAHASFYSLIDLVFGKAITVRELAVWRFSLLFLLPLVVVAVCELAYVLGYHNYSIGEKLVYKKKT